MTNEIREVPLLDGPIEFRGALHLERTESGVLPWRLPAWTRAQFPNECIERIAAMSTGVRLAFVTCAELVEIEALTTVNLYDDDPGTPNAGTLELVIDRRLFRCEPLAAGNALHVKAGKSTLVPGRSCRVRFDQLPPGEKEIELWLPHRSRTELLGLWADAEVRPPRETGRRRWLHYGSSVSHALDAESAALTWPMIAAARGDVEFTNLSLAGNAHLDPFVSRAIRDEPVDLISMEIGLNTVTDASFRRRTFGPAVHGFLDTIREGHRHEPLLVISPVLCPALERTPGPSLIPVNGMIRALGDIGDVPAGALTLSVVREELLQVVTSRRELDVNLHYLDGRDLLGLDDVADLPDGVHPNASGHRRMAERFVDLAFASPGPFFARGNSPTG